MAQFKRLHLSVKTKNNDVIFSEFVFLEDDEASVICPVCCIPLTGALLFSLTMQTHGVIKDQHHFIQGNGR